MSDNNVIVKGMSNEQIMQAIGQDDGSSTGTTIPRLSINRTPEDDDGNQLPVGYFSTYDSNVGQNIFGKPVKGAGWVKQAGGNIFTKFLSNIEK